MRRVIVFGVAAVVLTAASAAHAQNSFPTDNPNVRAPGAVIMCLDANGVGRDCKMAPLPVIISGGVPLPPYPSNAIPITGNAAGSTAAVVGTLRAQVDKLTYICGFNVQAIGGTATVGPITIAGLVGSSQVYQTDVNSATVGKTVASATFAPCIPASALNTAITITTTANGTATAVDVNSWGYLR